MELHTSRRTSNKCYNMTCRSTVRIKTEVMESTSSLQSSSASEEKPRDPEFSSLDRESETESTRRKGPMSSSPEEELAICLMLLSRDATWGMRSMDSPSGKDEQRKRRKKPAAKAGKFKCEMCLKRYRSSRALVAHKRVCSLNPDKLDCSRTFGQEKIFECPYCYRLFGSGQALGGHKRSHLLNLGSSATPPRNSNLADEDRGMKRCRLDLNLPASPDDDEFSVVLEE